MEQTPCELHMLRSLKGPCLSVLMALWLVKTPQSQRWLQRATGYGDEAVQGALEVLKEYNLVMCLGRYAWQITIHGKQLPLAMQALPDDAGEDFIDDRDSRNSGLPPSEAVIFEGTPEKPESDSGISGVPHSSSSRLINLDNQKQEDLLPRADSDFSGVPATDAKAELLEILDRFGIRNPARARIAKMQATPRMALYHLKTSEKPGQAIYRILANWPVPKDWAGDQEPAQPVQQEFVLETEPAGQAVTAVDLQAFGRAMDRLRGLVKNELTARMADLELAEMCGSVASLWSADDMAREAGKCNLGMIASVLTAEFGRPVTVKIRSGPA